MTNFKLELITTDEQVKEFLQLPVILYKNDSNWIQPLDNEIEATFDRKKNKLMRKGVVARWLLRNREGSVVGRVAAFVNPENATLNDQPTGGMGFFECINSHGGRSTHANARRFHSPN